MGATSAQIVAGFIVCILFIIWIVVLLTKTSDGVKTKTKSKFFPVRKLGCSGGEANSPISYGVDDVDVRATMTNPEYCKKVFEEAYPREPTVRDGTVAPLPRNSTTKMMYRDIGAGSAGVAEYMDVGSNPDLGIGRLLWSRAMADPLAGAKARSAAPNPNYQLMPGMPGTLVPESQTNDRPMSMPRNPNLMAGYAADGGYPLVMPGAQYNADFVPDGPFGAAMGLAEANRYTDLRGRDGPPRPDVWG